VTENAAGPPKRAGLDHDELLVRRRREVGGSRDESSGRSRRADRSTGSGAAEHTKKSVPVDGKRVIAIVALRSSRDSDRDGLCHALAIVRRGADPCVDLLIRISLSAEVLS
jgi:hypothetical protein